MQITQFVIGSTMAASYLFIHYTLPPVRSSPSASAVAGAAAATGLAWIKQVAFRAAGAEGIAENVGQSGDDLGAPREVVQPGRMITCMDTSGQGFAIWLNVAYLLPLTYLFARFFVRSYLYRKEPGVPTTHVQAAEQAGLEALKSVSREIQKAAEMSGETSETTEDEAIARSRANHLQATTEDSPIRTRSGAAKKAARRTGGQQSEQGFSPVPASKSAKKASKEEAQSPGTAADVKTSNPFGVLGGSA
jgi:hypothetical protein